MTPNEAKKRKRSRVLRVAVPVLLAGMFASLAVLENNGVFTSVNKAGSAAVEEHPAAVPVPFTRLAVLNRLENDGFSESDGLLLRNGTDAGTISLEEEHGILKKASYSLMLLPAEASLSGNMSNEAFLAQSEADGENARLVFHAVLESALGGVAPKESLLSQGEKKLESVLSASGNKTETLSLDTCTFIFARTYTDGLYRLTMEAERK